VERNYLRHRDSDANNAILAAVGYTFRLFIKRLSYDCARSGPRLWRSQNLPQHVGRFFKDDLLIEVREADDAAWTWHWNGWDWSSPQRPSARRRPQTGWAPFGSACAHP
jgi:hypothetical protein